MQFPLIIGGVPVQIADIALKIAHDFILG